MSLNPLSPFSRYLRPYRRAVVLGLVLLVVSQGISTFIPMVLKWAIDTGAAALDPLPDRAGSGDVRPERGHPANANRSAIFNPSPFRKRLVQEPAPAHRRREKHDP